MKVRGRTSYGIIMPLQQSVRTFGIVIDNGPLEGAAMQAWSHTPGLQERLLLQNGFFPKQSMKTCGMISSAHGLQIYLEFPIAGHFGTKSYWIYAPEYGNQNED